MAKYAVIGNPVEHSLSPQIHAEFSRQTGRDIEYVKLQAPLHLFEETIKDFQAAGGSGCNITLPFKLEAFELSDDASQAAHAAQAANCLLFREDGSIYADNYDGIGLVEDLTNNCHFDLRHKQIIVVGAGGATRGILGTLLQKEPKEIVIANRTIAKAIKLQDAFAKYGPVRSASFADLVDEQADLIIHATCLGHDGKAPVLPERLITPNVYCYDLSYGAAAKPFLEWAADHGAQHCFDGIGMLVEQAAASFYLWEGVYPNTQPLLEMFGREE